MQCAAYERLLDLSQQLRAFSCLAPLAPLLRLARLAHKIRAAAASGPLRRRSTLAGAKRSRAGVAIGLRGTTAARLRMLPFHRGCPGGTQPLSLSLSPPSLSRSSLSHTHPLASLYIGPLPPSLSPRKAGPEHHPSSSRWPLLGAASLHERGATRVAVAVSRARKRLLVAARLKRVQPRVAELDVDLGRAEGRVAVGSRQGMRRVAAGVEAVCGQCTVYAQCRGSLGLGLGWDEPRFWI